MRFNQLLLAAMIFSSHTVADACFPRPGAQPFQTEELIPLETELQQPHFYYRASLVVVFIPVEFVAQFRNKYTGAPFPLAQELMRAAPLEDHTDIFKAIILGSERLTTVEAIVADALEAGSALVYSPEMKGFASEVKVVTFNEVCHGGRRFYYSFRGREHNTIMTIVDWIS